MTTQRALDQCRRGTSAYRAAISSAPDRHIAMAWAVGAIAWALDWRRASDGGHRAVVATRRARRPRGKPERGYGLLAQLRLSTV